MGKVQKQQSPFCISQYMGKIRCFCVAAVLLVK